MAGDVITPCDLHSLPPGRGGFVLGFGLGGDLVGRLVGRGLGLMVGLGP